MSKKPLALAFGILLGLTLLTPVVLFIAPQHAQANDYNGDLPEWLSKIFDGISAAANPTTAVSTTLSKVKEYVLDPLAHALAQAVLKQITASVVNAINGTNGSPQFAVSLGLNLQSVGDRVGLAFIAQFGSSNHSPFAPAISTALRSNYLQQTSLAGFFAANQCTLTSASPNINSYLAGNFSQGGWNTWFSLTGPNPNNPFILYPTAQGQLASVVGSAQANQRQTIAQNNGFLSWCSSGSSDSASTGVGAIGATCKDFTNGSDCLNSATCVQTPGKDTGTCQAPTAATSDDTASTCYNKDGTPGSVQTPGSVIHDSLSKVTGSGIDSLVSVHDFNQMVDTILSALVTKIVTTGLSALSGSSNSYTGQLANSGTSSDPNAQSVASQVTAQAQDVLTQVGNYKTAWLGIQSTANAASATVTKLITYCSDPNNSPQPTVVNDAQTAMLTEIQPALSQAVAAIATASSTAALAVRVEADAAAYAAGTAGAGGAITVDTQALTAAPPSATDIANAQSNASITGQATSSSPTSLQVNGGSLVDQMALINTNAQNAMLLCAPLTP